MAPITGEHVPAYLDMLRRALAGEAVDTSGPPYPPADPIHLIDLDVVDDGPYPELLISFQLDTDQLRQELPAGLVGTLEARAPFEPEWLHLCGYDDLPGLYLGGPFTDAVNRAIRAGLDEPTPPGPTPEERVAAAPSTEELWNLLLARLAKEGHVSQPGPGVIRVDRQGAESLTVLVDPAQWRRTWALHVRPWQERMARRTPRNDEMDGWDDDGEGSRPPDGTNIGRPEPFLVHHDDRLWPSIRAALPPVTAGLADAVESRRRGGGRWFAYKPLDPPLPGHTPPVDKM